MTTEELLKFGEPTLSQIKSCVTQGRFENFYSLLDTPQPKEWIEEEKSELLGGKYYFNKIALIEGALLKAFGKYEFIIKECSIVSDSGQYAVTITGTIVIPVIPATGFGGISVDGIATTYAPTIKHLSLATPLARTECLKNAAKQLGNFFGKSLNRFTEDNLLSTIILDKSSEVDIECEKFMEELSGIQFKEDAELFLSTSTFKHYFPAKNIVNSKPSKAK